ncbi:MAG TPA: NAD(P)-binding domain-containing protein, partial [Candidatus Limnocylindria bacterium]|nr:NAD(P)-binding domain-containing protein [Candidatus Limnocylindria bacterium]
MEPLTDALAKDFGRDTRLAVIGLGYVGLPLAVDLADAGYDVLAVDTSEPRVAGLLSGESYVD